MDFDLPRLDYDRLTRAANTMIANYGKDALSEAIRRSQALRKAGCETTATTWESICKIIRARLRVSALLADDRNLETSHRVAKTFSFFNTP